MNDHPKHDDVKGVAVDPIVSQRQVFLLRHAIGLTAGDKEYRNHFVTDPGTTDYADCEALRARGLMTRHEREWVPGYIYAVTDAGKEIARAG